MTKGEKIWAVIGIFLLISGLGGDFPFFIPILIFLIIAYSVANRDKMKERLVRLIRANPETTIAYLANQLDTTEDKVVMILKMMILDQGYPIRLDLTHRTVTQLGEIRTDYETYGHRDWQSAGPNVSQKSVRTSPVQSDATQPVERQEAEVKVKSEPVELHAAQPMSQPMSSCIQCGGKLPVTAKFCHNCGVRQY